MLILCGKEVWAPGLRTFFGKMNISTPKGCAIAYCAEYVLRCGCQKLIAYIKSKDAVVLSALRGACPAQGEHVGVMGLSAQSGR